MGDGAEMSATVLDFDQALRRRDEVERLRTVLFWLIGDVEAFENSGHRLTPTEAQILASARAALGNWRPKGFDQ